jgi:hypothetical protein
VISSNLTTIEQKMEKERPTIGQDFGAVEDLPPGPTQTNASE